MKMYNASKEKYEIQCVGKVYTFLPNKVTEVNDNAHQYIEEMTRGLGIFTIYPSMTPEDIKNKALEALKNYLQGGLRTRIANYYRYNDEMKKKGISLQHDANLTRALRWDKEIRDLLKIEQKVDEELSYTEFNKDIGDLSKDIFNGAPEIIQHGIDNDKIENIVSKATSKKSVNKNIKDILNDNNG